jgi:dolichyl-phosphate-mannose-protein mannosyltransferase
MSTAEPSGRARRLELGAVLAILVLGIVLRLWHLDEGVLFIDEAESSLNALTILEHGVPTDAYLGLPLFENTLTEAWPGHPEYEFRDTSYSSRGLAIYHGWLPLYAIAGSFALAGIGPDPLVSPPRVLHDEAEIHARIRAARLPSVWFGGLFLVAVYLTGRALHGREAGLCALLAAALAPRCIWIAQQARYYSAALAFGALAAYCLCQVHRHGRWRDFALAGLVLVLLFHTSSLAFALLVLASLPLWPGILRHAQAGAKGGLALGLVALGLVPWMLWTGYFEHLGRIPMARELLAFPADYLVYVRERVGQLVGCMLLLGGLGGALWMRRRLPARWSEPLSGVRLPLLFLAWWILSSYLGFQLLVPAASCSMARLSHALIVAPILLVGLSAAVAARGLAPGELRRTALALGATLAALAGSDNLLRRQQRNPHEARAVLELVEHLRGLELAPDARLYALPYQHFCLAFYTGLPVQSIAPVRAEFLDAYPGEVLVLECAPRAAPPRWESLQRLARAEGVALDDDEARAWASRLYGTLVRAAARPLVSKIVPAPEAEPEPQPEWIAPVLAGLAEETARSGQGRYAFALDSPALFRGQAPMSLMEFWPAFFYAFVGPEGRRGGNANYARRAREAEARVLESGWLVLRCPARSGSVVQ